MRQWVRLVVVALTWAGTASVLAQDTVRLKYLPAYPPPNVSSEFVEIVVTRISGYQRGEELGVDRYFAEIEKILVDHRITTNWERVIVHAPSVHAEINIGGKKLTLGSSYSASGMDSLPDQDGVNDRHRLALEAIIELTTRRAAANRTRP